MIVDIWFPGHPNRFFRIEQRVTDLWPGFICIGIFLCYIRLKIWYVLSMNTFILKATGCFFYFVYFWNILSVNTKNVCFMVHFEVIHMISLVVGRFALHVTRRVPFNCGTKTNKNCGLYGSYYIYTVSKFIVVVFTADLYRESSRYNVVDF